jgi:serine/threonine protein kinase
LVAVKQSNQLENPVAEFNNLKIFEREVQPPTAGQLLSRGTPDRDSPMNSRASSLSSRRGSLADLAQVHPLSEFEQFRVLLGVCSALAYTVPFTRSVPPVHSNGTPGAILADGYACAYLADFGLARSLTAREGLSVAGTTPDMAFGSFSGCWDAHLFQAKIQNKEPLALKKCPCHHCPPCARRGHGERQRLCDFFLLKKKKRRSFYRRSSAANPGSVMGLSPWPATMGASPPIFRVAKLPEMARTATQ